jgi:hypothetical protein
MRIDGTRPQASRRTLARIAGMIAFCAFMALGAGGSAEEPMTTDEVVAELIEITQEVTPFSVTYDKDQKSLIFREVVESADKAVAGQIGELRARLDRMDPARINYSPLEGGPVPIPIVIKGKLIAGRANFFCRAEQNCIARGLRPETEAASLVDGAERTFGLDIYNDVTIGRVRRFADLIQHLIFASAK